MYGSVGQVTKENARSNSNSLREFTHRRVQTIEQTQTTPSTQSPNPTANLFRPEEPAKQAAAPSKDITIIQTRLIELGYLGGSADGLWGAKSRAALRAFKSAHGLDPDEHWNDAVSKRLFSKNAVRAPLPLAKAQ